MAASDPHQKELTPNPVFVCPNCGQAVTCIDPTHSIYFGCTCGAFYEYHTAGTPRLVHRFFTSNETTPQLAIGSTGTLNDIDITVVGFMRKQDNIEEAVWDEYLLYSPSYPNYHVLANFESQWSLVAKTSIYQYTKIQQVVNDIPQYEIQRKKKKYRLKLKLSYTFEIRWALGEFDWDITKEAYNLQVEEYADKPELLICETMDGEPTWYAGQYFSQHDISVAFKQNLIKYFSEEDIHRAILDPILDVKHYPQLLKFTLLMLAAVLVSQLLLYNLHPPKQVQAATFETTVDTSGWNAIAPIVTQPFTISQSGAVTINTGSILDNAWLEVTISLINNTTGKTYECTKMLEYYSGYAGGEHWTEGSQDASIVFSAVPAGDYHINIYPYSEIKHPFHLYINTEQSSVLGTNIASIVIIILLWPAILGVIRNIQDQ